MEQGSPQPVWPVSVFKDMYRADRWAADGGCVSWEIAIGKDVIDGCRRGISFSHHPITLAV